MFISESEPVKGVLLAQPDKAIENAGAGKTVAVLVMMLPGAVLFVALMGISRLRWIVAGSEPGDSGLARNLQTGEANSAMEFQQCPQESDGEKEE